MFVESIMDNVLVQFIQIPRGSSLPPDSLSAPPGFFSSSSAPAQVWDRATLLTVCKTTCRRQMCVWWTASYCSKSHVATFPAVSFSTILDSDHRGCSSGPGQGWAWFRKAWA